MNLNELMIKSNNFDFLKNFNDKILEEKNFEEEKTQKILLFSIWNTKNCINSYLK